MESARSVKNVVQPGDWLIKLDLKDEYLTVPMVESHQPFGAATIMKLVVTAGDQNDSVSGQHADPGPIRREAVTCLGCWGFW